MSRVIKMDGKQLSNQLLEMQKVVIDEGVRRPCLAIITVGEDDASKVYVKNKLNACMKCDIDVLHETYDSNVARKTVEHRITELNRANTVDGIIIQQPLPEHLRGIEEKVKPSKDVDGFTKYNIGASFKNDEYIPACTPNGIMDMFHYFNIDVKGKHVVVLGRSNIVGKPLIALLLNQSATVTSCNSYTENLKQIIETADILISAIGKPKFINSYYLSNKCYCIVDVGINRDINGKLCGDIDFEDIVEYWESLEDDIERYITPVPGGVGPMTVYSLMKNTNIAYCNNVVKVGK